MFFMCALRSAGIPCRQAYTPWWLTVDGNHAWPEVWTGEGWKCLERVSTENRQPEENWFTERARNSALVLAVATDSVPGAIQFSAGVSFMPVTSSYTDTGLLTVADDTTQVWVNIANHGALRRILRITAPLREVELGGGIYLLTWGWPYRLLLSRSCRATQHCSFPVQAGAARRDAPEHQGVSMTNLILCIAALLPDPSLDSPWPSHPGTRLCGCMRLPHSAGERFSARITC